MLISSPSPVDAFQVVPSSERVAPSGVVTAAIEMVGISSSTTSTTAFGEGAPSVKYELFVEGRRPTQISPSPSTRLSASVV